MSLELLRIYNARNLIEYSLNLKSSFNIFYGSNGAGKTTILESIYLLLRSRTFRSSKYKSFINYNSPDCTVFSRFCDINNNHFTLAISRSKESVQPVLKLNSDKVFSLSSITHLVLLGLITPESFTLLDAGPSIRRKFIDWGVFHVEPEFMSQWRSYKKIIANRNSLLKQLSFQYKTVESIPSGLLDNLNCWTPQLVTLNNKLNEYREHQVKLIEPLFKEYLNKFSEKLANQISLNFYRGWSKDLNYDEYLNNKFSEDFQSGNTRFGTHRSELKINYNTGQQAKEILSRGQKKIVILCLILAQFVYLSRLENSPAHCILLLDDIDSELDDVNLKIFLNILSTINCQKLITTIHNEKFFSLMDEDSKMFHVEPCK